MKSVINSSTGGILLDCSDRYKYNPIQKIFDGLVHTSNNIGYAWNRLLSSNKGMPSTLILINKIGSLYDMASEKYAKWLGQSTICAYDPQYMNFFTTSTDAFLRVLAIRTKPGKKWFKWCNKLVILEFGTLGHSKFQFSKAHCYRRRNNAGGTTRCSFNDFTYEGWNKKDCVINWTY